MVQTDAAPDVTPVVRHARGFTLERREGYTLVRVLSPWRDAKTTFAYALVHRGSPVPKLEPNVTVVETPVRKIVLNSSSYVAFFALLGLEDTIVGITGGKTIGTPSVAERIRDRRIVEIGDGNGMAQNLNMERLFALQPDLIMLYGTTDPQYNHHPKLQEAGFLTAINAEYMETTPLGRTEWMKFIAAFFEKDAEAERLFSDICLRYEAQVAKVRSVPHRPTVFSNANFRGTWSVPGGDSFVASFIRDAGGDYLWSDDHTSGSIPLNTEVVIARAKDADYWLTPGTNRSLEELAAADERYSVFRAFRTGRVYNNNAKMTPGGGNDIWETGVTQPDKALSDLISILHPELLPDYQRTWFWQLPAKSVEGR
jgi:iron complex transport system substrate-binding protein